MTFAPSYSLHALLQDPPPHCRSPIPFPPPSFLPSSLTSPDLSLTYLNHRPPKILDEAPQAHVKPLTTVSPWLLETTLCAHMIVGAFTASLAHSDLIENWIRTCRKYKLRWISRVLCLHLINYEFLNKQAGFTSCHPGSVVVDKFSAIFPMHDALRVSTCLRTECGRIVSAIRLASMVYTLNLTMTTRSRKWKLVSRLVRDWDIKVALNVDNWSIDGFRWKVSGRLIFQAPTWVFTILTLKYFWSELRTPF